MATIKRHATAVWTGSGKEGKGSLTTQTGTLKNTAYTFDTRFGNVEGTNPEELIAAAHAGCFAMALAFRLSGAGHPPDKLETKADLSMTQGDGGWRISAIALDLKATVQGIGRDEFQRLAEDAKANCPVSQVLNASITLNATLV